LAGRRDDAVVDQATVFSRVEHAGRVGSTNDVVRGWLAAGEPEICLATAGEQTAGRGRRGRRWVAPPGAALLASLGFRPAWLPPDRAWRLPATVALAMIDAGEEVAGLREGAIRLKWPNDLVIETSGPEASVAGEPDAAAALARLTAPVELRKLAGVLGESDRLGTGDPVVVVGIGINADWAATDFPPGLAGSMTSLREASGGRPIDTGDLLAAFRDHVEARITALRAGFFDVAAWTERQVTTDRLVVLDGLDLAGAGATDDGLEPGDAGAGSAVRAIAVDAATGALVIEDPASPVGERLVHAGEVRHVRLAAGQV
jgi:BirA family transcriptional regulator, biotin operon repressor / biotin---[acetyl-CoA-carboxylase] ligase